MILCRSFQQIDIHYKDKSQRVDLMRLNKKVQKYHKKRRQARTWRQKNNRSL